MSLFLQRIYTENGVLYITSPTADDSGQYICRVENRAGINQASITLWLAEETDSESYHNNIYIYLHTQNRYYTTD